MSTEDGPERALNEAFGAAARRIRERQGLTLQEVAERMSEVGAQMHQPNLSALEKGRRRWSTKHLAFFCVALQVDPLEFVTEMLPPDTAELVAAAQAGPAGVAGWLASRLK